MFSLLLGFGIVSVVIRFCYKKKLKKESASIKDKVDDILKNTLHPRGANPGEMPMQNVDHRKFMDIKIFSNDQVICKEQLGKGNFATVYTYLLIQFIAEACECISPFRE